MSGSGASTEDVKWKQNDNRLGRIVAFARAGAACCDGRFAAAISMDIKNLVITISREADECAWICLRAATGNGLSGQLGRTASSNQ